MDIGYLLELERCLERRRVVQPAAKEEHARPVGVQRCDALHILLAFERFFDALRQTLELSAERTLVADRDQAARPRNLDRDQVQRRQLRGICLGRRNRDLRARPGIQHAVRFARNRGGNHVDHRDRERTRLLGKAHRGQGVRRLARLADDDAHILLADDRVLIPELGRDLGGAADAAHGLDHALAHHTRVQRRAAADNVDVLDLAQAVIGQAIVLKTDRVVLDTRLDGICNRLGLLHDLLEHEVLIAALFRSGKIPVYCLDSLFHHVAELVHDNYAVRTDDCNLVII